MLGRALMQEWDEGEASEAPRAQDPGRRSQCFVSAVLRSREKADTIHFSVIIVGIITFPTMNLSGVFAPLPAPLKLVDKRP